MLGMQGNRQSHGEHALSQRVEHVDGTSIAEAITPNGPLVCMWSVRCLTPEGNDDAARPLEGTGRAAVEDRVRAQRPVTGSPDQASSGSPPGWSSAAPVPMAFSMRSPMVWSMFFQYWIALDSTGSFTVLRPPETVWTS